MLSRNAKAEGGLNEVGVFRSASPNDRVEWLKFTSPMSQIDNRPTKLPTAKERVIARRCPNSPPRVPGPGEMNGFVSGPVLFIDPDKTLCFRAETVAGLGKAFPVVRGGRRIGEYGNLISGMARRPDPSEFDKPLSQAEVKELRRRLSFLSPHHVAQAYREAHQRCCMNGDLLPRAAAVQEMVTAWKLMKDWRKSVPPSRD